MRDPLIQRMVQDGRVKEELFRQLVGATTCTHAEDLRGMDLKMELTFNVKSRKKLRRSDPEPSNEYHWLEIRKKVNPGWVFGGADFIVFEAEHSWIIVSRQRLEDHVRLHCGKEYSRDPEPYKLYKRTTRDKSGHEILSLVPISDLKKISLMEITK